MRGRRSSGGELAPSFLLLGGLAVLGLSLAAVVTRPEGSEVAMWWPASAVSAWLVLKAPPSGRLPAAAVVLVAVAAGNGLDGRGLTVSVAFGLCNALEALSVAAVLSNGRRRPRLRSTADLARLLLAVLGGAVVIAGTAGPAAWWLLDADPAQVGVSLFASHGSALLLLLPLFLDTSRARGEAGPRERAALLGMLVVLVLVTFGPGQDLPVSLVPVAALVWCAMRCGTRHLLAQNAATAAAVTALTLLGWGPYAAAAERADDPLVAVTLVQLFGVIISAVVLAVACLTDERRVALREVEQLSSHDPLTGAGNRRLLEGRMREAAAHAARGIPGTLLLLDLDGFKAVNDGDGHLVGDTVLVAVSDRLRTVLRPMDTLVRSGGDEFVVLLHGVAAGSADCEALVERVRSAVAQPYAGTAVTVGVSIGAVPVAPDGSLDELLRHADRAMYQDKRRRPGPVPGPVPGAGPAIPSPGPQVRRAPARPSGTGPG